MNASEKNMNIKMLQMMELTAKINLDLKNGIMQKETTFYKDDTNMGISFFESSEKQMIRLNLEGLGRMFRHLQENGIQRVFFDANQDFGPWYIELYHPSWAIACQNEKREFIASLKFKKEHQNHLQYICLCGNKMQNDHRTIFENDMYPSFKETLERLQEIAKKMELHGFERNFRICNDILEGKAVSQTELWTQNAFVLPQGYRMLAQKKVCVMARLMIYGGSGNWDDHPQTSTLKETNDLFRFGISMLAHAINFEFL